MKNNNCHSIGALKALLGQNRLLFEDISEGIRPLTYTSFDGDDMLLIPEMEENVIRSGNVPINPESALGYYLSTEARNRQKREVMLDCITLEFMSERFNMYTNYNYHIPEGVQVELALWEKYRSLSKFKLISAVSEYDGLLSFNPQRVDKRTRGMVVNNAKQFTEKFSDDLHKKFKMWKNEKALVRKTNYIVFDRKHYKYSDWLRKSIFDKGQTPISPHHLLDRKIYQRVFGFSFMTKMFEDRLSLLEKADNITIFLINAQNFLEEFALADIFFKFDVIKAIEKFPEKLSIVSMSEAKVPKYLGEWALTSQESMENKLTKKDAG